jgi:hypothetical protein
MNSMETIERKRGGCLTAFLILAAIANPLVGLYYLAQGSTLSQMLPDIPPWIFPVLGILSLANLGFVIAIWQWKKWGAYGFFATAAIVFVMNALTIGAGAFSVLLGVALLGFLLRSVWDEME